MKIQLIVSMCIMLLIGAGCTNVEKNDVTQDLYVDPFEEYLETQPKEKLVPKKRIERAPIAQQIPHICNTESCFREYAKQCSAAKWLEKDVSYTIFAVEITSDFLHEVEKTPEGRCRIRIIESLAGFGIEKEFSEARLSDQEKQELLKELDSIADESEDELEVFECTFWSADDVQSAYDQFDYAVAEVLSEGKENLPGVPNLSGYFRKHALSCDQYVE